VIVTDVAPPTSASLARLPDVRVVQYWDRDHVVSADIVRAVRASPDRYALGEGIDAGTLVWDTVVVFPPGARWEITVDGTWWPAAWISVAAQSR
jgi:hypothetical protein